jgi:CopG family nickel-responsive transcriptional regulator
MDEGRGSLIRFGISMPEQLVRDLDRWRRLRGYDSRSEAVRDLVREALVDYQWRDAPAESSTDVVGVVTIVYAHSKRNLSEHLTEAQHHRHTTAHAALHVHLSEEHCLEVIVLRGRREDVQSLADDLITATGVLHGKFVPTTTGEALV